MIKFQYRVKVGKILNLNNPKRYTEKLQWYKLNYRDPIMVQCVDKYDVREFVEQMGFLKILNPCYGVFDSPEEIEWERLPSSFVMKDTLGSGSNSVMIIQNKNDIDLDSLYEICQQWVNTNAHQKSGGREWPYYSGKRHRIVIEALIKTEEPLIDYKFFCFNGKVECIYVIGNRILGDHGELAVMDRDFHRINVQSRTQREMKENPVKPENFCDMVSIAEELSKQFPHVRVDLYNVKGKIIFGELTFFGASGYQQYNPDSFDFELGNKFILPMSND